MFHNRFSRLRVTRSPCRCCRWFSTWTASAEKVVASPPNQKKTKKKNVIYTNKEVVDAIKRSDRYKIRQLDLRVRHTLLRTARSQLQKFVQNNSNQINDANPQQPSSSSLPFLTHAQYLQAKALLGQCTWLSAGRDYPEIANLCVRVMDILISNRDKVLLDVADDNRISSSVTKSATTKHTAMIQWVENPKYINHTLTMWKRAAPVAKRQQRLLKPEKKSSLQWLISPQHVMKLLIRWKSMNVPIDAASLSIVMDVIAKGARSHHQAPYLAVDFLDQVRQTFPEHCQNPYLFSQVMQAWATSKLPEAAENLARLEQYMRKHMIRLNGIHYSILLRFWGTQRDTDKLDELFRQMMEFEKIMPNIVTYDGALLGYAQCDKITKARWCLEGMIQYKPNHPQKHQHRRIHRKKRMNAENDKILIAEGAYQILLAYRRASLKSKVIVNEAKEFYDYIALHVSPDWIAKSTGVMVDIYSQCGNHEEADKLKKCIKVSGRALRHVVKLYTKKNMADQATTTWKQSLENGAEPTLESLNTILAAWARSRQRDSFDRALEILRFVETDPQCNQFFLRPDETSFQSLLLCLARSKNGKGQYVMEILEEMGRRKHLGDQSVHLNEATRSLAIQACIRMGDLRSAEEILRQTETSETPPSTRMYNSILKVLHGSVPAAERAEQILAVMKQSPRTQPDIHTYTIVLNAWTKANDTYAFSRAWKFYEQMRSDGIQPNHVTFSLLFTCFCQRKNPTRENLERADILLQHMADSDHMRPHNRHFTALIKAWLCIGEVDHALRLLMLSVEFRVNDQVPEAAPVTPIIDAILNAFIERGDIDKAIFVAEKMSGLQEAKLTPDGPSIAMLQSLVALWSKQEKCHIDYYYYDDDVDPKTIKTSMLVQKIERRILDWQIQEDDTELRRFDAYQSKQ